MTSPTMVLKCPACAGPLQIREGDTHTECPNCGSSLMLPDSISRYLLPVSTSRVDVLRSVRRELQSKNRRGVSEARVSRPILYYVPFWHCSAQVNGYITGVEPVYKIKEIQTVDTEGQAASGYAISVTRKIKTRTGANAVEREIQLSGSVNISAADLEPLGIPSLSSDSQLSIQGMDIQRNELPRGLQVLKDEGDREGVFVDPVVPVAEARLQAEAYLRRMGSGVGFGLEERWEFSVVSGHRESLIFYPLWVSDFSCRGRAYQVVVDGRSGQVLRGRFPSSPLDSLLITMGAAILWAAAIPPLAHLVFSGKLNFTGASGKESSCLPVVLLLVAAAAYGTWHLLKMLGSIGGRGNDHVIH